MMKRRRQSLAGNEGGFVLIALVALLAMGGLYFFISNLTPELVQARRQQMTGDALTQAREALIGYAVRLRESNPRAGDNALVEIYGYLPLPDLGSSRNNNSADTGCYGKEGCEAYNFSGNAINTTVIGRFPWRTIGTGPLRDGHGECLWYAVSGSHQRNKQDSSRPMNWDALSQMDIVIAKGTAAMTSAIAAAHDRPIAVIFSPGPPLDGQDRSESTVTPLDVVSECGGNYDPKNYLDPADTAELAAIAALAGTVNFFPVADSASPDKPWSGRSAAVTSAANKEFSIGGITNRRSDATLWANGCSLSEATSCSVVANDRGLAVTSELLFRTLRGSIPFRSEINSMLDRMVSGLRDQGASPVPIAGLPVLGDKTVGRIPDSDAYGNDVDPRNYYSNYKDQIFVAQPVPTSATFTVTDTSKTPNTVTACSGVLIFAGQRGTKSPAPTDSGESLVQLRDGNAVSATNLLANTNWPANYLEGTNLTNFTSAGASTLSFIGPSLFTQVSSSQAANQDIVRCIPAGKTYTTAMPDANNDGVADFTARTTYDASTRQLTLGSSQNTYGSVSDTLSSCQWTTDTHDAGSGFRKYFRFRIRHTGEGFTFAVVDGDRNSTNACGAARQHLGYSGKSPYYPYIEAPKLAVEFDTSYNCSKPYSPYYDTAGHPACVFTEGGSTLSNGRNDPCYTSSCGGQGLDNSSHVGIAYWGYGNAVSQTQQDDNVHDQLGLPMPTDPSSRPAPRNPAPVLPYVANPATIPGVAPLDRLGSTDAAKREFHARVEVTRTLNNATDPKDRTTSVQVQLWIEPHQAASITSMTWSASNPYTGAAVPTLTVVAPSHGLIASDTTGEVRAIIKDAVPTGFNGEYVITYVDSSTVTAAAPLLTASPGRYISSITWSSNVAYVTSPNHGLATNDTVTIANAVPTEFNGTWLVTRIDSDNYRFSLPRSNDPGDMSPAIAAAKTLSARPTALSTTTRSMTSLDPTFKPLVSHSAVIYDEQTVACGSGCPSGQSCSPTDNMCYRPSFRNLRLGFTAGERASSSGTARNQWIEFEKESDPVWLP